MERKQYDGIDGGQKNYSNSGGVSRLCMYSSAAHISLRQGCRDVGTPECCIISNKVSINDVHVVQNIDSPLLMVVLL